jgi:hypothetical protein
MPQPPQLATIDDACAFIRAWFGWTCDLAGAEIRLPFAAPPAIETLNRRLGRLWLDARAAPGGVNVLDLQDTILPPHAYEAGPDGVAPMIWENQGVWGCGFKPEANSRMWVKGDWPDGLSDRYEWRPVEHPIEAAVLYVLLGNTLWGSRDCAADDEDDKPAEADRLLWTFAPWPDFAGFWTNDERSLIRMQGTGWGVTARR